jgi:phosphoribosyl 1,2-cyclic phosphodiesterase
MIQTRASFTVRFWGVRGSIPVPGDRTLCYGGNTPCVEVRCGERLIILDGGTGLRALGATMLATGKPMDADILLSHCHLDHIGGLLLFLPLLAEGDRIRIWAGNLLPASSLQETLCKLMNPPLFPVSFDQIEASVECRDFRAGAPIRLDQDLRVRTAPLCHPGGATGYRLEFDGKSLTYMSDHELGSKAADEQVLALASTTDLLIADSTYTEAEIASRRGWGHSTWQESVRLADRAGAKSLCLFHHEPSHDDEFLHALAAKAQAARPGTFLAREGLTLEL